VPSGKVDGSASKLAPWLWSELRDHFEIDDGSLPEIRVDYADPEAMIRGYATLREQARNVHGHLSFWSISDEEARPLDSVPNAATLVVSGEAEPFHVLLVGVQPRGITLPDLGVFVDADRLTLDYRMGDEWGPAEVESLFALLSSLAAFDPRSSVSLQEGVLPEVEARFQRVWRRFLKENAP
jgi:hypothetical protein